MAVKIARGAGDCVQIGNSDYPLNAFRAIYLAEKLVLVPKKDEYLLKAPKLTFNYSDLVDEDDAPIGTTAATVRPVIQAILYSTPPATEPAG